MGGSNGQTDGNGRRNYVASVGFIADRVNNQDKNKGNECFYNESLSRLKQRVYGCLA